MKLGRDLIVFNLAILGFLTLISVVSGNNFLASAYADSQTYQLLLNGTASEVDLEQVADFSLDPLIFAVIWIVVIGLIAVASSLTILATGLSGFGSKWVAGMVFFVSIWLMLSTYPYPLIIAGGVIMETIYLFMTITYAVGSILTLLEAGI